MCFKTEKNFYFLKRCRVFLFILLFAAVIPGNTHPQLNTVDSVSQESSTAIPNSIQIDKIVAVVNNNIITLTDLEKAILFYPDFRKSGETLQDFQLRALEDMISYKVVYLESQKEVALGEEDYNEVQSAVIEKLGSLEKLLAILGKYNMEWTNFKEFIKEKVVYDRVIKQQLRVEITISFKEIEEFYNKEYRPAQEQLELKPRSLIEMTPQIENHLKKVHIKEKLAQWLKEIRSSYKIENKLLKEQS